MVGRLCLGVQELRRRRAVGHGRAGRRLARADDVGADDAGRQGGRGRGRPRHGDATLPAAPEGRADVHQFGRLDLCLDARARPSRQARRRRRARQIRCDPGEGHGRHRRVGLYDEGPCAAGGRRSEMALHHRLPRQSRRESQAGDGVTAAPQQPSRRCSARRSDQANFASGGERPMRILIFALSIVAASTFAGAASAQVPSTIAAPGESAVVTLHAEGAQVYECKAGSDGKLAWAFREPIATLLLDGKTVGRHYAGPNWEHVDGSAVVGKAVANVAGKTPSDIPWLKLEVTAHRGSGLLSGVKTVQRINTRGGAHAGACDRAGALYSAPYSADYVFLKKGP